MRTVLEAVYPPDSLVVAYQRQTHASMVQAAGDEDAVDEICDKIDHVFQLHYGNRWSEADDLAVDMEDRLGL